MFQILYIDDGCCQHYYDSCCLFTSVNQLQSIAATRKTISRNNFELIALSLLHVVCLSHCILILAEDFECKVKLVVFALVQKLIKCMCIGWVNLAINSSDSVRTSGMTVLTTWTDGSMTNTCILGPVICVIMETDTGHVCLCTICVYF